MRTRLSLELPAWLVTELPAMPTQLGTAGERMALVNALADRNYREGNGGPFAALVADRATGEIISVGVNVVLQSGIASAHAEVMALSLAQVETGSWDLGADRDRELELVVNWRPCVMCYGSAMWSGIRHLVVAGSGPELERLTGFDEGPMRDDWAEQFEARGITVTQGVGRDEALAVFRGYGEAETLVYNARSGDGVVLPGA
ncbi:MULTISPECIES: nucleoside deaminase [Subtercola]|uniref:Nucleoside deaminase n=1 Tax=Subtercola vilae TaxID=2056433 RepID=A0A4T2BZ33_9MICO|nr:MULTISPECIES: nucleoside deaminase [Subtercola]MEA9985706.1 nucleoside deaminase [Subtercola sp. RTI3]TIH37115.1 nucleoside deaminase [Subtercola vilae]